MDKKSNKEAQYLLVKERNEYTNKKREKIDRNLNIRNHNNKIIIPKRAETEEYPKSNRKTNQSHQNVN